MKRDPSQMVFNVYEIVVVNHLMGGGDSRVKIIALRELNNPRVRGVVNILGGIRHLLCIFKREPGNTCCNISCCVVAIDLHNNSLLVLIDVRHKIRSLQLRPVNESTQTCLDPLSPVNSGLPASLLAQWRLYVLLVAEEARSWAARSVENFESNPHRV